VTMHIPGSVRMHHHLISWAVAVLFTVMGSISSGAAPSTDRDRPTPLTSNEIRGTSGGKAGEYYYTFIAGPGQVALTLDAMYDPKHLRTNPRAELFDMNANSLLQVWVVSHDGQSDRKVGRAQIPTRQPLIMRVTLDQATERFLVRVEGAVELVQTGPATEKPSSSQGKLRIEMDDGSVQDIDLSHVRRLTIEP
jgi:hypothetical protein